MSRLPTSFREGSLDIGGRSGLIRGAVAQLGERRVRNAEVGSSILLGSTKKEIELC